MRILVIVIALIAGLIGLAMSVCGGVFLLAAGGSMSGEGGGVALLALPSIVVGALLVWACVKIVRGARRPPAPLPPSDNP